MFKACALTLVAYAILEAAWLTSVSKFYVNSFSKFASGTLSIVSLLAAGLVYVVLYSTFAFLVLFRQARSLNLYTEFLHGAAFGLAAYGTYNLTNKATLSGYPWTLVVVDSAWGTFLFGTLALIYTLIYTHAKRK